MAVKIECDITLHIGVTEARTLLKLMQYVDQNHACNVGFTDKESEAFEEIRSELKIIFREG